MKLHLPKSLRTALLSCLAAISPWSLTLASGAISVGAVVFSLGAQAQAETITIIQDTSWPNDVNHSTDETTVDGVVLTYGNNADGSWNTSVNAQLGSLTLINDAQLKIQLRRTAGSTVKTTGTTDKAKISGSITLDGSSILIADGSYYFADTMTVKKTSEIKSSWAKGIVIDSINGDDDAKLSLVSDSSDSTGALFVLGDGSDTDALFSGIISLENTKDADKSPTLAINDGTAFANASLLLNNLTNAVISRESVMLSAVFGGGDIVHSANGVTGADTPVLQITGNATDAQTFSGTMASNVTWQIGDGTTAASSRFAGATLNGTLDIKTGSTAYLTGDNTFGTLTNNGTLHLSEGSSFVITSQAAYQGAVLTLGTVTGLSGNTFSYGNGWLATYDSATGTATITDNSSIYWIDNGVDGNTLWSAAENWQGGVLPTASDIVRLGADCVGRIVSFEGDATVGEVRVAAGDYGFVASGNSTLTGTVHVAPVGATLTKSGAGILTLTNVTANALSVTEGELVVNTLSLANGDTFTKNGAGTLTLTIATATAAKMNIAEGTLKIGETLMQVGHSSDARVDLTALSSSTSGVLSIAASGNQSAPGKGTGTNVSHITLSDAFTGIVEVRSGKLHVLAENGGDSKGSDLGGATGLRLDGGGILITSSGTGFAGQSLSLNLEVGASGGYIDLFGGSTNVQDGSSAKHTGNMTGSGVLTFIGMGEWVLAGDYSAFTGGLALGEESQHLYISSNMENLKSLDWTNAYSQGTHKATVVVGYDNTAGVKMTVAEKQTVSYNGSAIKLTNGSTFTHTGGVTVADNTTFNVTSYDANSSGIYNTANVEFATATSKLAVAGKVVANITGTAAYTATCGTIDIASGATVNDNRALTIDGAYNITGAGTYNQLGTLALTENGVLTLSGKVSINSLAGNNAGVLTFADLSSLELKDFVIGEAYEIGTVTDGANVDWQSLMGYTDRRYSIEYDNGMLNSVFNDIVWSSPVDDDITWGGSDNWVMGGESVAVEATDSVLLGTIGDSGVSPTIQLAANTTVAGVTVQDDYSLSVAEGETYSFDAGSIVLAEGGSLSKVGAGTLSMSSEDAVAAQMHIAKGTLALTDEFTFTLGSGYNGNYHDLSTITADAGGVLQIDLNGTYTSTGCDASAVKLSDSFYGVLSVVEGQLLVKKGNAGSVFGGTTEIRLNQAALYFDDVATVSVPKLVIGADGAYITNRSTATISSAISGSGALTVQANENNKELTLTGAVDLDGALTLKTGILTLNSTTKAQFDGGVNVQGGVLKSNSDADMASLTAADGSRIMVDKGASLNTATTAVSGTVTTGATEGATLNMGAVTVNANGTLKIEGAGAHTLSTLAMGNNATLELGANTNASITTATAGTTTGDNNHPGARDGVRELNGVDFTIKVGTGAELTDAGAWELSGGSDMIVSGGGVYHVAGVSLGVNASHSNSLTIGAATTLHITGTNTTGSKFGDSFSLGNWDPDNTVTVNGVLALECGISTYKKASNEGSSYRGYAAINVGEGGKIAFNNGLHAVSSGRGAYTNADSVPDAVKDGFRHVAINIAEGGVLEVSGTNVTGSNSVVVNVAQNGIVMGGNANGATESKITNNLLFDNGAYIGAKKGTTLTIAPEDGSTNLKWLDIIGTADTHGSAQGAGGKVVFDSAVTVVWNVKVHAGAEADFNNALTMTGTQGDNGLYNYGKLTVDGVYSGKAFTNATGAEATFNSGISLLESVGTAAVVDNSGNLTVTGTTAMIRFNNKAGAEATFNSGLSLFESAGTAAVVDNSGKLTVNGGLTSLYSFNNASGAETVINGDVTGGSSYYAQIVNSGKVSFNGNVEHMSLIRNSAGGEMTFAGEMNGSANALQNAGKLVFDGATVRLENAILNGGTVEILNAADTQFVLSNELMQEIVGVSKTWTLVNNTGMEGLTGTVTGWDALGLENFLLDGSALQLGDWDDVRITDGKVMLYMQTRYWDATGEDGVWNTGADANWREFADATETVTFETNSRVTFTDTDETGTTALDKSVTVADGGVHAKSVTITGTGYVFSGGKVLVNQSLSALHDARFDSAVVIGSSAPLQLDVADGATLTLSTLETVSTQSYGGVSYGSGAFRKTGAGTLLITDAINGTITGATVSGGKLALGSGVNLAVGANTVTGGSLGNVELLSSGTVTDYTGATAQANNVIKSADGVNYAMLTDVALHAGAATGYASLQKVAFAGNSTLSGYITYESTKQQRQMAVATGGTLTVSNLTFDLHGLSAGTKVLIENKDVAGAAEGFKGELLGWTTDNVTLLYSGIAVNSAAVNMGTAGVVVLNTAESINEANMYWDGLVAGAASSAWDKSSANWSTTAAGTDGIAAFLALSNTYFGATPEGGSKDVNAAQDIVMSNMFVTEGAYSFTGSRLATLGNMHITPASGEVSFANELVAQGNVTLSAAQDGSVTLGGALQAGGTITASGEGDLSFNSTVQSGGDITLTGNGVVTLAGNVSTAGKFSIGTEGAAVMDKADASTLYTIAGTLTAKDILINMDASTLTAAADTGDHLVVSGNVSAMGDSATPAADGTITLLGSAAKKFTGFVTADTLRVNAAHGTLNNVITFTNVVDVNTLEIAEDTYVRIVHADSDMDTVLLGGTLYMDTVCVTYDNGYDIYSTSDAAELVFGTISSNTINLISGLTPAEAADDVADAGQYNSISVNANTRFLTVNALADLKDLTLYNGPMTVKAGEGAIHGNLVVRDAAGLSLTQNANNIMAEGSGSITVDHANMNLNSTTQTLRSGNDLYLAGGSITGNANGVGLNFVGSSSIHYTGNNTISANMTVAEGTILSIVSGKVPGNILMLNGNLNGNGDVLLTGSGLVSLGAANAYTGTMTVTGYTQLRLDNTQALDSANLVLSQNGVLIVDRSAVETPFTIGGLALNGGTLQIDNLMAMDAVSAQDAALKLGALHTQMTNTLDLTLSFTSGELQTMKTYNLFTAEGSYSLEEIAKMLNLKLSVVNGTETLPIADNQYKLVYDADSNVIAIRTMLGNIWDGGTDGDGDGIWSTDNTHKNWSGSDYVQATAFNDAIFADLTGEGAQNAVVTIQGTVNPGDVYFESGTTVYELNATADGAMLAAGNVIHKAGAADVTLNLAHNDTAASALGGLDLQAGATKLASDLAVKGEVSVAAGATLQTGANKLLMVAGDVAAYTAQGTYSGLTMDATGIAGVAGAPGSVTNGIISGAAELSNLNLTDTGTLTGVTIGSGVTVATDATYTLSGLVAFNDTLLNNGTVNFAEGVTVELGGLSSNLSADGTSYIYQLVQGDGTINGLASGITAQDVFINGVNLSAGLADGIATVLSSDKGTVTISIGAITSGENETLTVDGSIAVTSWDARWGEASGQPSLAKRYDGATNISFSSDADYHYGNIVSAENADKVNGGNAIVVSLAAGAFNGNNTSELAAGAAGEAFAGHETWVYDSSDVYQVVAGQHFSSAQTGFTQNADTHLYVDANNTQAKAWVVGGSWNVAQEADSYVTVENGTINSLVGAGVFAAAQFGTAHVYVDGGTVSNIYGAGFENGAHLTANTDKNANAVEMLLTGGTITNVYGGAGYHEGADTPTVTGNIAVTVEGNATITTLYGGSMNGGAVTGNINLDLISGSITTVHAAGASGSTLAGNVTVTLHNDDVVSSALYGGKQNTNKVDGNYTSTLYLAEAGEYVFAQWQGDAAGTHDGLNQVLVAGSAVTIAGFDVVSLAQGAVLTVDTNHFDRDITNGTLVITGNGIVQMGGKAGARRDIRLENGAIFKLLSSYTAENYGAHEDKYDAYSKLYVTDGTTFDISGYPRENDANDGGGSIAYHVYLSGDGVDGMGALYKGATDKNHSTNPSGKAALGYIELTGNASATAEHNIAMIGPNNATTYLDLNGYTFTKRGEGAYVLRNTVINGGTYYGHEGTVQPERTSTGADADLVLAAAATLKLNDDCNFTMRSLTGSGDTELGAFKLTLAPVSDGKYYAAFMDEANSYDNLMSGTGFAYGVYSGKITGAGSLYIGNKTDTALGDRTGVQYLSGTDSTYSGGTHVEAGRLYLLSSTQGSISKGGSEVTSGPIGTGALYWDSTTAEVYLGHGVTVYNAGGTNVAGSDLILGVEGAPDGDLLKNYPGVNGTVVKDGVTYHEVDTHNLQSISCDGVYADGTAYVAGTEIDRNKMLLVTEAAWNSESSTVKGFTDTGYNEATYSGVLSGAAALVKVGAGTLVIDQANAYTGGTRIQAGTLKLKGWAQIGAAADGTIDVTQTAGSTLMLAYDGTYGDELSSISNNMVLKGEGDARWKGSEETGGGTAALISDVGSGVTFTLSGDISGEGNLLHSGEGTLVLSGDSSFTGGTHATRGVVEVQSATGLGAGKVNIDSTADLHVTVEDGTTASRVATTLAADGTTVQGDVVISGTESTERILNVATGGYDNSSTTLHDNGTLLVNGEGVSAKTALLTGSGTVAVSDATGSGASATVGQMTAYTGDFVVEGNNASITVENGSYSGGSISVSGNDAVLSTKGDITITNGESLSLSSRGNAGAEAGAENDAAYVTTTGSVSVASGATLSVSDAATSYEYNLQNLQAAASLNGVAGLKDGSAGEMHAFGANTGADAEDVYSGFFKTSVAMNQKAAGAVKADGGLTLAAGATYETAMANTSLLGGSLTLESGLTLSTTLDLGAAAIDGSGRTTQLVLFSDVSSVNFVLDNLTAVADSGIYYTKAENYITGSFIDEDTWLVYDSGAGVVYLDGIVPEPTTATLSLLALAALAARRRRR